MAKIFKYIFVHQKENPQKPHTKVKRTREEMQAPLENRRKIATKSPRSALMRKNIAKEGGTLGLGIKKEHESIKARVQKMMRGRIAPSPMPTLV